MNNSTIENFPSTAHDISNLKQTATDAAADLGSTLAVHGEKVRHDVRRLAQHAQEEGAEQLSQVKGQLSDVGEAARQVLSAHPLKSVGIAFAVGYLLAWLRRD